MKYPFETRVRVALPDFGPEAYAVVRHPKLLPAAEYRYLSGAVSRARDADGKAAIVRDDDGKPVLGDDGKEQPLFNIDFEKAAALTAAMVLEWNLPDPDDETKVLALPADGGTVPTGAFLEIFSTFGQLMSTPAVPKASSSP